MALISLHRICLGIADEAGDTAYKYLARYMRYANVAVRDLVIYVVPEWENLVVVTRLLPIGNNFMIDLPDDYISYIKVGICGSGGGMALLGYNDNMCAFDTSMQNCPCTPESTQTITDACCGGGVAACDSDYNFNNAWLGNSYLGELYGKSGGRCYPGYFREDKANNRLILNTDLSSFNGTLVVEYKADPTMNGVSMVPSECELAIREFVHWRNNLNSRPSVAQMHQSNYQTEYARLKKLYSSITADEWRSVFLQATTSTVKR